MSSDTNTVKNLPAYGFVEMGSGEQARHAVSSLEGSLFATLRHNSCIHSRLSFPSDGRKGDPSMSRVNWKLLQNRYILENTPVPPTSGRSD